MQKILRSYETSRALEFGFALDEFRTLVSEGSDPVNIEDLVLARACARGNEQAWNHFVQQYRGPLYRSAVSIARNEAVGRELADSLFADLFGSRKLATYSGRGSLEGWLRTVLAREYVNCLRGQRRLLPFEEAIEVAQHAPVPSADSIALAHSTDAALAELSADERILLSAYYLDGRTLAEIGCILDLHESTVSRRLSKLTRTLRKRILKRLQAAGFPKRAAEEMLSWDVRELAIDVRSRLAEGSPM